MKIPIIGKALEVTLKIAGLWPNQFNIIGPICMASAVVTLIPFQCWDALRSIDNPVLFFDGLSDIMSEILLYIKITIMWINRSYLLDLLREISDDYTKKVVDDKWLALNHQSRRFCKYDYSMYLSSSMLFYLQFILIYIQMPVENRDMLLRSYYPFDFKSSPIFEIMNIIQVIQGVLMCSIQAMCESLLIALVFHVCGHIDLLADQINMYSQSCGTSKSSDSLTLIISRHLKVLKLVTKIESVYTYVSLAQVFFSTLIICATGFVMITITGSDEIVLFVKYISLYILMLWQVFSYCFVGQHLINKSGKIADYMYSSLWYNAEAKEMKAVSFIITRSQMPLLLTAGKFTALSTQTFTLIIKTSFSYLSVLRAGYN